MKDIDEISQGKMVTKNTTEQSIVTKPVITKEQWLVLGTLMLGVFMGAIDISIVSPALPAIAQKLSIDSRQLSWVITLYLLVYVVATPLMSALSDRWGRRRIFIFDVLIFGIGSLWAAFSGSLFHLLSARALPRAYYSAVIFVIALCVMVAIVTVGSLPIAQIVNACDYALAAAAKPFMGQAGFTLIAIAALLSTVSAIDATLYGAARLSYIIAVDGELPHVLEKKIWNQPVLGLLLTAALTLVVANLFDLTSISTMGSSGFLLVFAAVNFANVRLVQKTHSRKWLSLVAALAGILALAALLWQTAITAPPKILTLVVMVGLSIGIEILYRTSSRQTRTAQIE